MSHQVDQSIMESFPDDSGKDPELFRLDTDRLEQVDCHQQAVVALLDELKYDGLLLTLPENFSWFTCGGDSRFQSHVENSQTAIFITRQGRVILTHDVISPQLFDREIAALGFHLKERSWRKPVELLYDEITRGRSVVSDSGVGRTRNIEDRISQLRAELSPYIEKNWQSFGNLATYAVEATCRNLKPGITEAEIAGEIAHRLFKREILPVQIQVIADDRLRRYRHWSYTKTPVAKRCLVNVIARKKGFHFAISRSVTFHALTLKEQEEYQLAGEVLAEILSQIKPGVSFQEIWQELTNIHKQRKLPNQWRSAEFAWQIGYRHPEQVFKPQEDRYFLNRTPWYWQSTMGSTMIGLSLLINNTTLECFKQSERWPVRQFEASDGTDFVFPEILETFS